MWLTLGLGLLLVAVATLPASELRPESAFAGAELFASGAARQLRIEIAPAGMESLRTDPRAFVHATVTEEGTVYENVAIHLKGSVGSFREVDDKPDLTLDFDRFIAARKFHGLRRIHLNNSVEDPSYCNELLGGELFRAAGVPAPRVAHAVVTLNGRRLGLYVLIEGFTEDFLGCYFKQVGGDLYEPGEGHDVNQQLRRNSVKAPKADPAVLKALADAALETNAVMRWPRLGQTLDIDQFVTFMAMEVLLCHRDGYGLARNNYRVYHDPESGKIVFFPHGMDQLFGNPEAPWQPGMAGLVARAVMGTPEGRTRYETIFASLLPGVFHVPALVARVDKIVADLRPSLTDAEFAGVRDAANVVKDRIVRRQMSLRRQLSEPKRELLVFTNGIGLLGGWSKADESPSTLLERGTASDHTPSLHIVARSGSGASWRTRVFVGRGRYRFEGRARVSGVKPLSFGKYQGAGLRVAGSVRKSGNLVGESDWRALSEEFEVAEDAREVELICELRAGAGEAWFGLESLRLVQIRADSPGPGNRE